MKRVLIGVSGSVAAIKFDELARARWSSSSECEVRFVFTDNALNFIAAADVARANENNIQTFTDHDEWREWGEKGDPVMHVELVKWADVFVLAPLSANTLAKIANGLCDNLLTCVFRAWDFKDTAKRVFIAPAMNTKMWESPFTERHLRLARELGVVVVPPIEKHLACGDFGIGAMAEISTIAEVVRSNSA
jgi:phosphopantothenoylcysteine synthetase/decarboxylase